MGCDRPADDSGVSRSAYPALGIFRTSRLSGFNFQLMGEYAALVSSKDLVLLTIHYLTSPTQIFELDTVLIVINVTFA